MSALQATLDLIKAAQATDIGNPLAKGSFRTDSPSDGATFGPKFYNLDTTVQQMYPVVVPLLKEIPRRPGGGGNAFNYKQITAVNPSSVFSGGVEGQRGAVIDHTFRDVTTKFVTSILESSVTWQSELASQGLSPQNRALSAQTLIAAFLKDEHWNAINANGSLALGTTPTPALAAVATGGSLAAGVVSVIAVALTGEAARRSSVASGIAGDYVSTNAVGQTVTVPGGFSKQSAAATVTVVASGSIAAAVADVPGATSYAWYAGAAGSERLVSITGSNVATITALNGAGQLASAAAASDRSANPLRFDGILAQLQNPGSGAVVHNIGGAALTPNGSGGVVEIDAVLEEAYDKYKVAYTDLWVSAKDRIRLNAAILGAPAGSGAARLVMKGDNSGVTAGTLIAEYLNPVTGTVLALHTLPDLPQGTMLFWSKSVDYAVPDSTNLVEFVLNADYFQIEYPMVNLSYDIGIATYGTLCVRFPPAFGLLKNIGG